MVAPVDALPVRLPVVPVGEIPRGAVHPGERPVHLIVEKVWSSDSKKNCGNLTVNKVWSLTSEICPAIQVSLQTELLVVWGMTIATSPPPWPTAPASEPPAQPGTHSLPRSGSTLGRPRPGSIEKLTCELFPRNYGLRFFFSQKP